MTNASKPGHASSDKPTTKPDHGKTPATAQPFSDDAGDEAYLGMGGGAPKPRPDQRDDVPSKDIAEKTTQRQE